jgi:hypothetical protein
MLKSSDGGATWSAESWTAPAAQPSGYGVTASVSGANLFSIDCLSTTVCVAVGQATYTWNGNPPPVTGTVGLPMVVTTNDGGETWSSQLGPHDPYFSQSVGFLALSCLSVRTPTGNGVLSMEQCLVEGVNSGGAASYELVSNDAGATWRTGSWDGYPPPSGSLSPHGVVCLNTRDCLTVGENLESRYSTPVVATSDAGNTWMPEAVQDSSANLWSVACTSPDSCWAVGGTSSGAVILHTSNGGHAWPEITAVGNYRFLRDGSEIVTITGTHFDLGIESVSFGSVVTTSFTVDSPTQITANVPPLTGQILNPVDVTVNTLLGPSPLTRADQFFYFGLGNIPG